MKIFQHIDDLRSSSSWHDKFYKLLTAKYGLNVIKVDLSESGVVSFIKENIQNGDAFVGRIMHDKNLLEKVKPIYDQLCDLFEDRCYPCRKAMYYYDDKLRQFDLFLEKNYPIPETEYVTIKETKLEFPLVQKKIYGASSSNVSLINSKEEIDCPCMLQKFCKDNFCDVRINVIGHRVMGCVRKNRPNDFRASGSGLIEYPEHLPKECLEIAYSISEENQFDSMSYDFVYDVDKWLLLEMSYTYRDDAVYDCPYYYDMKFNKKVKKNQVWPEEFILEDFINRCFSIKSI